MKEKTSRTELQKIIKSLNLNFSFVSAIIEREHEGEIEILVQTRWKPDRDPLYSGTLEIPAGAMDQYEDVYDAITREVLEETGLKVTGFKPDVRTRIHTSKDDECFAFVPFCCQQQLRGEWPRVGFVFICSVEDKEPVPEPSEVKNIHWIKRSELKKILEETPEKIFVLQSGVLDYYLNYPHSYAATQVGTTQFAKRYRK
jgi:8-oxo-dGTP pyrophosphatase MutT (NUDIX family)